VIVRSTFTTRVFADRSDWKDQLIMSAKLSVKDLSRDYRVPEKTIYHWRSIGYGPVGVRVGRRLLFDEAAVEQWFQDLADAQAREVAR